MADHDNTLYGNVPDKSPIALLLIDVINDLEFAEGARLLRQALPMARRLARLKKRAKQHGCATIYVNDNFGRWRSDFQRQVDHCLHDGVRGQPLVELLQPDEDDYFVLKPAYSGFYSTTLELLLQHLGARSLIVAGVATNLCVLFTANDAYLRGFRLWLPADCVAANSPELSRRALQQMASTLGAKTTAATKMRWAAIEDAR